MHLLSKLSSVIFPHKCTFCRKPISYENNTFICPSCMKTLPFIKGAVCLKCNTPREISSLPVCSSCRKFKHSFSRSFTPLIYTDSVRKSLISMKFYNKEAYCRSFAFLIVSNILDKGFPDIDFISFVPLSDKRYSERGFNQAEIIARFCGELLNVPVISTLFRVNDTPRQSTLSLSERRKNAKKSFFSKDIRLNGTALLVDDIYTTGSTADYCSSLLLKMGCEKVYIAAVALKVKN